MSVGWFDKFSNAVSRGAGSPPSFALACALIVVWAVSGPIFGFSEVWQLVINTTTTIVTFLMVFLLQHSQNRDSQAVQAKLDDLILSTRRADNRLIGAEELTSRELQQLRRMITAQVEEDEPPKQENDRPVGKLEETTR